MEKVQSLADYLGTSQPLVEAEPSLEDIRDPKQFAEAVLTSREFRSYIINALAFGNLPAAVVCRLMDYAWGKPPDRVEHTGKDGHPIQSITEVRRVIIHVSEQQHEAEPPYITH